MEEAGRIAGEALRLTAKHIKSGVTALELDSIAADYIFRKNGKPSFKGYNGYPANICVSINEEIVHGIPRADKVLKTGDVVSIDIGVYKNGFHGDTAATFVVENNDDLRIKKLIDTARRALYESIDAAVAGKNLYDISFVIQTVSETAGFSVVRDYTGHGIGAKLHEDPFVYNYVPNGLWRKKGIILKKGYTFAIEPMLNLGSAETRVLDDNWTVVTADRQISAHFEHTIAITGGKPIILTRA